MNRFLILILPMVLTTMRASDLALSNPANLEPMPAWAVGGASRAADLDVLPGFQKPPPGFGAAPFYWWLGDPLTKERLGWQLEQIAGMGVSGYQINWSPSPEPMELRSRGGIPGRGLSERQWSWG